MVAMFTPHFNASRFYDDDAGEAASAALAAQDTAGDVDVSSGNKAFQFRARIDETGNADGSTMDDYGVEYEKNDSTTWVALTTTDNGDGIRAVAAGLTNDAATTNRSSEPISDPGAGSFVDGEQSSDGVVDDLQVTASNFTELAYGAEIVAANVADGDTFDFRFSSASGVTNNVEPRVDVVKAGAPTPVSASITAGATVGHTMKIFKSAAVTAGPAIAVSKKISKSADVTAGAAIVSSLKQVTQIAASVTAGATVVASNVFIAGGGPGAKVVEFVRGMARGIVSGITRTVFRGRRR